MPPPPALSRAAVNNEATRYGHTRLGDHLGRWVPLREMAPGGGGGGGVCLCLCVGRWVRRRGGEEGEGLGEGEEGARLGWVGVVMVVVVQTPPLSQA